MARKLVRKRSHINATIRKDLHEFLRFYSEMSDVPISKLLDRAILMYAEDKNYDEKRIREEFGTATKSED